MVVVDQVILLSSLFTVLTGVSHHEMRLTAMTLAKFVEQIRRWHCQRAERMKGFYVISIQKFAAESEPVEAIVNENSKFTKFVHESCLCRTAENS